MLSNVVQTLLEYSSLEQSGQTEQETASVQVMEI